MKSILIVILLSISSHFNTSAQQGIKSKNDSCFTKKCDTCVNRVRAFQCNMDTIVIQLGDINAIKDTLKTRDNLLKDVLPSLIALIAVLISAWSVALSRRQINHQIQNAEDQLKSQEAQGREQLMVAREQIKETSKMTLAQVRANNISQARIEWIKELRDCLTQFNGEVALINFYLNDVLALSKDKSTEAKILYDKQIERIRTARELAFKIKLFLNKNETNHSELESLLDEYKSIALDKYESVNNDIHLVADKILNVSRIVLKEAWEQAKNEGT